MKIRLSFVEGVIRYIATKHIEELKKDYFESGGIICDLQEPLDKIKLDAKELFFLKAHRNESWPPSFYAKIPHILVKEFENGEIAIGGVNAKYAEELVDSLDISTYELNPSLVYENLHSRREAAFEKCREDHILHEQFTRDYAHKLARELKSIPDGRDSFSKYEVIVKKILDLFFDDLRIIGEPQKEISNRQFRLDICYYMCPKKSFFYDLLFRDTKSSYLIVECKNSKDSKELGKAISQIQKYFTITDVCNAGIIAIREKKDLNKMSHYSKMISDDGLFLIVLDDKDLINLITSKRSSPSIVADSGEYQIDDWSPLSELYKLRQESRLEYA